jgi:MoaA/NifB/PqqE/SkfB family radical SAM enzyme
MYKSKEEILFKTVKEDNILPITSICKLNCIFCSHKNNPSEVETYSFGHLEFELVKRMIEFLDEQKPVFIGESASKIIEGEPFSHPRIMDILKYIRERWPKIEIKITSSASFIEEKYISELKDLSPVDFNISLNAPAPEDRVFLMNDPLPENVFEIIKKFNKYNIKFQASIVSMHHILDFDKLIQSLDFLESFSPLSLRIFLPGFSRYASEKLMPAKNYYNKLNNFIENIREKYNYPIIIEPQLIDNLSAKIEGIIKNTPAYNADLKRNDEIIFVNGYQVESRVDAFYKIEKSENPELIIERSDEKIKINLNKSAGEKSGLIMSYDINRRKKNILLSHIELSKRDKENISTILITSQLAYNLFSYITKDFSEEDYNFKLLKVKNNFFGGSIMAAGLLVNNDLDSALKKIDFKAEKLIIPEIIYDYYGNDLLGKHYSEIEDEFGVEVILL